MADEPHLLTSEQDGILIVSLNRPDKLNALSGETMQLFEEALLRFRDSDDLRVMLIRGNGRYFCAGADMRSGSPRRRRRRTAHARPRPTRTSRRRRTARRSLRPRPPLFLVLVATAVGLRPTWTHWHARVTARFSRFQPRHGSRVPVLGRICGRDTARSRRSARGRPRRRCRSCSFDSWPGLRGQPH